jgi:hypothetical protein
LSPALFPGKPRTCPSPAAVQSHSMSDVQYNAA